MSRRRTGPREKVADIVRPQIDTGDAEGYRSASKSGGPGILVLHAWWGLNTFIKSFCQRLASAGFVALAPDLYHGKAASSIDEAKRFRSSLNPTQVLREIEMASDHLKSIPSVRGAKLGVVGFSLGGYWAMQIADRRPDDFAAVVLFYGIWKGRRKGEFSTHAMFQGHFAEDDQYESLDIVKKVEARIRAAGREVVFHVYPKTGHWFMEDDQRHAYDPTAAALAWERTTRFLHSKLAR